MATIAPPSRYTFNYTVGLVLRKANFLQSFNSSIPIGSDLNIVWRDVDLDRSDLAVVEPHRANGLVTLIGGEDHASRCGPGTNQAKGKPSLHEYFDRWADRLSSLDLGASLTWRPGAGPSSSASCAPSSPCAFPLADYAQRDLAASPCLQPCQLDRRSRAWWRAFVALFPCRKTLVSCVRPLVLRVRPEFLLPVFFGASPAWPSSAARRLQWMAPRGISAVEAAPLAH